MTLSDAPLGSRVYLDTNLYIYLFEEVLAYNGRVQRWPGISASQPLTARNRARCSAPPPETKRDCSGR